MAVSSAKTSLIVLLLVLTSPRTIILKAEETGKASQPSVEVITSLIWSGLAIEDRNLKAYERLSEQFPQLTIHHFISPAYAFGHDRDKSFKLIRAHVRSRDRIGLYLYPGYQLTKAAGAIFRSKPAFFQTYIAACAQQSICGYDTPLSVYEDYEVLALFRLGTDLIRENLKRIAPIFMIGVWDSSHNIRKTAAMLGYKFDFSPIKPKLVSRHIGYYPGYAWLETNWKHLTEPGAQPYFYQDIKPSKLIAVPQNGGMLDYTSLADSLASFEHQVNRALQREGQSQFFQVVIHFETLAQNEDKFAKLIQSMVTLARTKEVSLRYYPSERDH